MRIGIGMGIAKKKFRGECELELQFIFNFWSELNCNSNWYNIFINYSSLNNGKYHLLLANHL